MTGEQLAGILRAILAALGGYLVGQGILDAATATSVSGAVVTLAVAAWSYWTKRPTV